MALAPRHHASGRKFRQWNLGEELQGKVQPLHFSASFCIVGASETGRQTLAMRFADMDADEVEHDAEHPSTFYNSFHVRTDDLQPVTLHLMVFIGPKPEGVADQDPPTYIQQMHTFCCLVFMFDVSCKGTLDTARGLMHLHVTDFGKECFLVGNKSDRRAVVSSRDAVARREAEEIARKRAFPYFECSAKTGQNVGALLHAIEEIAIREGRQILV